MSESTILFGYDWGLDALVFGGPKGPMALTVKQLQAVGWVATSEGFRNSLPRMDPPNIQTVPGPLPEHMMPGASNRAMRRANDSMGRRRK